MMLIASVSFAIELRLRHEIDVLFPMTRIAVIVLLGVTYVVARRYLAPRMGTTVMKAGMFGMGAATLTLLYFSVIYAVFETGDRISNSYLSTMVEAIDSVAEIATRVLTNTFDILDFTIGGLLAFVAGMFAEIFQRMWGDPIRAPRV